jgi:glycerophosphoryl diester phosphodiesterase
MEIQEVIGRQCWPEVLLVELGRQMPHLLLHPDGDEEGTDRGAGVVDHGVVAPGAPESVRGLRLVLRTDPNGEVVGPQTHDSAARALSLDGCHEGFFGTPPGPLEDLLSGFRTYDPGPVGPITFAHRGARSDFPENTLPAFRHALDRGARGLETDAWLTSDGEVALVHNGWVRVRRFGVVPSKQLVHAATGERLRALGVPLLQDLYAELGAGYELSIDLKSADVGPAIVTLVREVGTPERLWLCSPAIDRLTALRDLAPEIHLVHSQAKKRLAQPLERHGADLSTLGIDALDLHHAEWTPGLVALFHRFGVQAFAWDVQEVRQLRAMFAMDIDAVYCDHVDRMVTTAREWEGGVPERA